MTGLDPFELSKWDPPSWDNEPMTLCIEETLDAAIAIPSGSEKACCWHWEEIGCKDGDWDGATEVR